MKIQNYFYVMHTKFFSIKNTAVLLFLLIQNCFSQSVLNGKIVSEASNVDGILIINISNNKTSQSKKEGLFSIQAKPTDTLYFSGMQIIDSKIILKESDFLKDLCHIRLKSQINQLEEVVIKDYNKINSVSAGILSKPAKKYTVAERRIREATSGGGIIPLNPIINAITGRTSMLKKELEVEKRERLQNRLSGWFQEDYYIQSLKIPIEYIKGFQIFVLDDERIIASLKAKNKTMTKFLLSELSEKYLIVIKP